MFKKLLSLFIAAMMVFSLIPASIFAENADAPPAISEKAPKLEPDPTPNAANDGEGTRQINTGHIAIDNDPAGGYAGNYVVIYNPSESSSDSRSTGNMSGRIQTSISANVLPGEGREELIGSDGMFIIDVDAEMEELAEKLYGEKYEAPEPVRQSFNVGDERDFTVPSYSPTGSSTVRFKVLRKTDHCYIWTITSTSSGMYPLSSADAQSAANEFEAKYNLMNSSFGTHNTGSNGDGRVHILYYNIQDNWNGGGFVGGYFTNANYTADGLPVLHIDTYPSIYYNNRSVADTYNTVVHEYQHMIHRSRVGISETWINECMSAAAEELCYPGSSIFSRIMTYTNCPWTSSAVTNPAREYATVHENLHKGYSMYAWDGSMGDVLALYAQVSLFSQYMFTQYPNGNGVFNAILTELASGKSFQQACPNVFGMTASRLVRDFRITMTANSTQNVLSGRYRFALQSGYNPSEYYGVQNPYNILGPIIFTENSCSIKGGGSITVKPVNGVYNPPAGADPNLEYYGITLNAPSDVPPVEPTPTPAPKVYSVEILDFEAPTWGATPNDTVNVPNGAHYSISLTRWRYRPANSNLALPMSPSMTFNDPTLQYDMIIYVQAEDGYVFHTSTSGAFTVVFDEMQTFDFNSTTELFISTRLFSVVEPDPTPVPTEAPPATSLWDFESDPIAQGFEFRDQDGDGYNWNWKYADTAIFNHHEGSGLVTSASYDNTVGVLTPDNWLITPVFTGTSLSFWAQGQDAAWAEEYLGIFVSTNGGSTWSGELAGFTLSGEDTRYSVDLSTYEGQSIRLAIRHYNVSDQFNANVDYIEVRGGELPSLDEALNVEGGTLHFESTGTYPWVIGVEGDRIYAYSGNAGAASTESVLTTVIEANNGDRVSFEFKAWGEGMSTYWDYCEFAIDGERVGYWGEYQNNWETFTTDPLTAGTHTLTWTYSKDSSLDKPGDCFMVDNVEITEYSPEPTEEPIVIDTVELLGFTEPVYGEHPAYDVYVPDNAPYTLTLVAWGNGLTPDSVFAAGQYYYAKFEVEANDGYIFSDVIADTTVLINGSGELYWSAYSSVSDDRKTFHFETVDLDCEAPANIITHVDVLDLVIPTWGAAPVYAASVPEGAHYSIDWVEWFARNGFYQLGNDPDAVFNNPDERYEAYVILTAAEGYEFAEEVTATINGQQALVDYTYDYYGQLGIASIGFTVEEAEPVIIDTIEILGFTEPALGEHPDFDVYAPEGAPYTIMEVTWVGGTALDPEFIFVPGMYYAIFDIKANEGYIFAENSSETTVLINGSAELYDPRYSEVLDMGVYYHAETISICLDDPNTTEPPVTDAPQNAINEINILDFVAPSWGAEPNYNVTVPDDAHYIIQSVLWFDGSGVMQQGDIFCDTTTEYYILVEVIPEEGYFFDRYGQGVVAMLNGDTSIANGPHYLYEDCIHICSIPHSVYAPYESHPPVTYPPEYQIDTIELNGFVEPVWGAAPSCNITVPEGANYTITEQGWYYYDGMMEPLEDGDLFNVEGREYSMIFRVEPAEGYSFTDEPTVTINGRADLVGFCIVFGVGGNARIDTIDFTVSDPANDPIFIDTIELNGFVEPAWGAAPTCNITVPDGAHYTIISQGWFYYAGVMCPLADGDLFNVEGREYSMIFRVEPAEGYSFTEEPSVTINGREDLVGFCIVSGVGEAARIDTVDFTVTEPAAPMLGDVNGDGEVTIEDALLAMRYVMTLVELTDVQFAQADVDGNGEVTMLDCLIIMRYAAGAIDSFPELQ